MTWVAWALLLILQNATFTLVSRARNSNNIRYHAIAAVGSNGVFFASLFIVVGKVQDASTWLEAIGLGLFYTLFTIVGSVGMHWLALEYVERTDAPRWIRALVGPAKGNRA